jgi:thiamine kinase-like enzyme
MPYIKNNNIFDIKYININYNVSRFKDIQVINSLNNLSISNKWIKNLYDFFKVFLCYLKKTNLNIDLKVLKKTFLFLEKYKEIFISDENLYFIHWDFTSDNFIINKSKIYVIDFSNSGYFDFYYDICCFINFDKNKDKILLSDIKLIFKKNWIEFNTIRYRFNQLLYDLMD